MNIKKKSKLYVIWIAMRQRCNNPNNYNYKNYGAKGIKVCDEWNKDYISFYEWAMSVGYQENSKSKLTIDRIDNSKGYNPNNCRFLTIQEQQNNKTNNHLITLNGETHTVTQWAKILDINVQTIFSRIRKGLTAEEILSKKRKNKIEVIQSANKNNF